jgi:hypothetical protein
MQKSLCTDFLETLCNHEPARAWWCFPVSVWASQTSLPDSQGQISMPGLELTCSDYDHMKRAGIARGFCCCFSHLQN